MTVRSGAEVTVTPLILFGGTFDPVHRAHISCARAVSRLFHGASVELLPNADPPHRQRPATGAAHRQAMLTLACKPWPTLRVNDWELRQSGPSYSLNTLQHFRQQDSQRPLILVIGADSLASFHHWHHWHEFAHLCHLVVAPRPGAAAPDNAVLAAFPEASREALLATPAGLRLMLTSPNLDVSATAIRQALAEKGQCPALEPAVLDYIQRQHLYNVRLPGPATTSNEDS